MPIAHRPAEYEGTSLPPRRTRGAVVDIKRGPRKPARAKTGPPDQTNAESFYYLKQMNAKTPMVVVMTDGEEIRGWIEWYDKSCLKINREGAPNLVVQKHCIKYLFKQDELTG